MLYKDISLDDLKNYSRVIVTGPQRSGTTIASHIIACDLEYKHIDERQVDVRSMSKLFKVLEDTNIVVQGPCFCSQVAWIDTPDTIIIMMKRDINDIVESETRISWDEEKKELSNYFKENGVISAVRYEMWDKYQKPNMKVPFLELSYESLKEHPLWIEKPARSNFDRRQYMIENEEFFDEVR